MILTVTLNASIDKRYQLSGAITDYEVQRVSDVTNTAGGKGINCTRAIAALGEAVFPTGFVGGFNGDYLCSLLSKDGIANDFVHTTAETRSCINVLDATGASTEFLEPSEPIDSGDLDAFAEKYERLLKHPADASHKIEAVTLNGSLPQGAPCSFYRELIRIAHDANVPVLLDTSGGALLQALPASPTFIKPNLDELEVLLQDAHQRACPGANQEVPQGACQEGSQGAYQETVQIIKQAKDIQEHLADISALAASVSEKYRIPYVAISLGKDGALLYHDERAYYACPPKIDAVNPVGSGDTMVGAFAVGFARGFSPDTMLISAIAAASANCLTDKTGSFEQADYRRIKDRVSLTML